MKILLIIPAIFIVLVMLLLIALVRTLLMPSKVSEYVANESE